MKIEVVVTGKFEKEYKKLSGLVKESAKKRELIFRENPFDLRLNTHKASW